MEDKATRPKDRKAEVEVAHLDPKVLWETAIPIENALLQTSVRFMGKEEGSLHKFMGAEFRVTADWSVLMKHKGHFAFVPNTNVKIGYFKPGV